MLINGHIFIRNVECVLHNEIGVKSAVIAVFSTFRKALNLLYYRGQVSPFQIWSWTWHLYYGKRVNPFLVAIMKIINALLFSLNFDIIVSDIIVSDIMSWKSLIIIGGQLCDVTCKWRQSEASVIHNRFICYIIYIRCKSMPLLFCATCLLGLWPLDTILQCFINVTSRLQSGYNEIHQYFTCV